MILSSEAGGEVVSATLRQVSSCLHVRLLLCFEPHDGSISSYFCFIVFYSGLSWKTGVNRLPTTMNIALEALLIVTMGFCLFHTLLIFPCFPVNFWDPRRRHSLKTSLPLFFPPFTVSQTQPVSASLRHVTLSDHPRTCVVHLPTDDSVTVNLKSRAQSDCSFFRFRWFLSRCFDAVCAYFNILFFLFLLLPHIVSLYN